MKIFTWINSLQMDLYNYMFMSFCTHYNNKFVQKNPNLSIGFCQFQWVFCVWVKCGLHVYKGWIRSSGINLRSNFKCHTWICLCGLQGLVTLKVLAIPLNVWCACKWLFITLSLTHILVQAGNVNIVNNIYYDCVMCEHSAWVECKMEKPGLWYPCCCYTKPTQTQSESVDGNNTSLMARICTSHVSSVRWKSAAFRGQVGFLNSVSHSLAGSFCSVTACIVLSGDHWVVPLPFGLCLGKVSGLIIFV